MAERSGTANTATVATGALMIKAYGKHYSRAIIQCVKAGCRVNCRKTHS